MSSYSHQELRRVFELVMALPADQRNAALTRECRGDASLQARIEAMLAAAEDDRFLASPTGQVPPPSALDANPTIDTPRSHDPTTAAARLRESPGARIGPFKLLQLIGEGGFGSVFMAEQEHPVRRKVALKIIKLGMDTRQVVARFEQERQALAMMDHPNIARVLDAGVTDTGRPFFVMELVKGDPIVEYCDKNSLSITERLDLFAQVCTAVQHAHTKGIIHRDIKPSNILVSLQDGRPNAKVIDFGIAKATNSRLTEKTLFTEHRQLIGTPEYMSPEQAEGSLDIDTRTDVYSLGVLLYELLTGSTPFNSKELRSAAYAEIQRIIREVDPPKPSTRLSQNQGTSATIAVQRRSEPRKLGLLVRGDLDWIVMKALEKDRSRRYETANGLAADIRRFLSGEAVVAAPPSASYKLKKLVRRNKGPVTAVAAVAAALIVGLVAFAWQASVARTQRDLALAAQRAEAEQRVAADAQRDRAVAAERDATSRAKDLRQVADFQSKMLNDINPTEAGEKLMKSIKDRFAAALAKEGLPESDRNARSTAFALELGNVNATDTAVELIDGTIIKPAITAVQTQFKDQPIVDAALRHTLADLYRILGRADEAITLQEQALAIRRKALGDDHPDTLTSLNNLGVLLEDLGKLPEAEARDRDALERRLRVLGKDHSDTLTTMGNLGNLLREQGKFAEAEPLLRACLEGQRRVLGPEHRDTLIASNTYGFLMISQGKFKDAEPYWREAYETGKRVFGPDDRDVLVWTHNMGGLLNSLGRSAEAEPFYREALDGARRVHGLEHPSTLSCLANYGNILSVLGRSDQAEPYLREALDVRRRTLGSDHPDTLSSMITLGGVLREQGKFAEAESYMKQSLEGRRRTLGKDHPATLDSMGTLARLYNEQSRYAEAEALLRESLELSKKVWGEENPARLVVYNNLGSTLLLADRTAEAEPYIRRSYETRLRVSGPNHPETIISQSCLSRLLEKQGKLEEAEQVARDALDRFRKIRGNEHPNTINAVSILAGILQALHKWEESEALWREDIAGLERTLGKDLARTGSARLSHGRVLTELSRFDQAEPELLEAQRILSTAQNVAPGRLHESRDALARLYQAWDRVQPGKGFDAKAADWKAKADATK